MKWPWSRSEPERERRESQPFTDAVIQAIVSQAEGSTPGDPAAIAALETAAALYSRAFAAAKVTPATAATEAITPAFMSLVARNLIRRGEDMHLIEVRNGAVRLAPCGSWDVRGDDDPETWLVRGDLFGPSGNRTVFRPHAAFIHARYAVDPARPWYGIGPLGWARHTGTLAANLENKLGQEAGGPVGHVIPVPTDGGDGGEDDALAMLKRDVAAARGRTILTETTAAGYGEGKSAAPARDWVPARFGANPPMTLATLRDGAAMSVLDCCGVPRALAESADGTAAREGWRRFVMGSVEPLLAIVREELAVKLDVPGLAFDLSPLWAHDIAGRAAAFKGMVTAGMELDRAAGLSGLVAGE